MKEIAPGITGSRYDQDGGGVVFHLIDADWPALAIWLDDLPTDCQVIFVKVTSLTFQTMLTERGFRFRKSVDDDDRWERGGLVSPETGYHRAEDNPQALLHHDKTLKRRARFH